MKKVLHIYIYIYIFVDVFFFRQPRLTRLPKKYGGNYAVRIVKGTVNIYGGYFHSSNNSTTKEGTSEVIYLESAWAAINKCALNIYGGVFETDGDASYLINCKDNYRSKCKVKIMGGIFVGFNPADNTAEGANTNFLADGYVSKEITYNGKQAWEVTKAE